VVFARFDIVEHRSWWCGGEVPLVAAWCGLEEDLGADSEMSDGLRLRKVKHAATHKRK